MYHNNLFTQFRNNNYFKLISYLVLFVFSLTSCGGGGGGATTANNNTSNANIKSVLTEQNDEARNAVSKFVEFTQQYDDAIALLNDWVDFFPLEDSDIPFIENDLDNISETLEPLADELVTSTTNLISLEQQIQNSTAGVQVKSVDPVTIAGALALLTILGAGAAAAKGAMDAYKDCSKLPRNFDELDTQYTSRVLECTVQNMPQSAANAIKAVVTTIGETLVVNALPHGKVKTVAEIGHNLESVHQVQELIGERQESCSTENNAQIKALNRLIAADVTVDDLNPGDLYIGQASDGPGPSVFPSIPEGDWAFLAFSKDNARAFVQCVHISADETATLTIDFIPIDQFGENIPGTDIPDNTFTANISVPGFITTINPDLVSAANNDTDPTLLAISAIENPFGGLSNQKSITIQLDPLQITGPGIYDFGVIFSNINGQVAVGQAILTYISSDIKNVTNDSRNGTPVIFATSGGGNITFSSYGAADGDKLIGSYSANITGTQVNGINSQGDDIDQDLTGVITGNFNLTVQ